LSRADKAVAFIAKLKLTGDYHGKSFCLRPWQEDFVRQLFALDKTGKRQIRKALYLLPRKQAKTMLLAALILIFLVAEPKSGQEIYSAAASREQAARIFTYLCAIINQSPWLRDRCRILQNRKEIIFVPKGNTYRALSSQSSTAHGLAPNVVVCDELHAWEPRKGRLLYEALTTGFGHAQEPLLINISTAGNSKHSLLWEEYS
jgi:phage terminase large subunit-like protein